MKQSVKISLLFRDEFSIQNGISNLLLLNHRVVVVVVDVDGVEDADHRGQRGQDAPEEQKLAASSTVEKRFDCQVMVMMMIGIVRWNSVDCQVFDGENSSSCDFGGIGCTSVRVVTHYVLK
jgi:hypothetical protein